MPEVNRPLDPKLVALIEAGSPIADAIRIALWRYLVSRNVTTDRHSRGAIPDFATHRQLDQKNFASSIYNGRTPNGEMIDALIDALGGSEDEWRELLWRANAPLAAVAS